MKPSVKVGPESCPVEKESPLDSRTKTTARKKFDLKCFFMYSQKIDIPGTVILLFFSRKVSMVIFIGGG